MDRVDSWFELAMAQFLFDRGGFWQLKEYEQCSFLPYRDVIGKIIDEEAAHHSAEVRIGSTVTVKGPDNKKHEYQVVGPADYYVSLTHNSQDGFRANSKQSTQRVSSNFGYRLNDDVESRMMPAYLEQGLLKRNPFETIDRGGVGELVKLAAARGRSVKPGLKLGVCGEHGGDPESIQLFYEAGLDYVSCSPFRVPVARLAAAQAALEA